jgi:molybdenum cofactor cytidylyltransferase
MIPGAVVLAAGASTRFGPPKQCALFQGEYLVRRAARTALEAGCRPVVVVAGREVEAVNAALLGLDTHVAVNCGWASGIGTSIRRGLEELLRHAPACEAVLFLTGDQPLVTAEALRGLCDALAHSDRPMAASAYAGTLGVPALFRSSCFAELRSLADGAGAKQLLGRRENEVVPVVCPGGECDIDRPEDLARLLAGSGRRGRA